MENRQLNLSTEKVGKLMGKYAIPCIISLLVGALYNIVDQIFIANATILVLMEMRQIQLFFLLQLLL